MSSQDKTGSLSAKAVKAKDSTQQFIQVENINKELFLKVEQLEELSAEGGI